MFLPVVLCGSVRAAAGWLPTDPITTFAANATGLVYGGPFLSSSPDYFTWGLSGGNCGLDFAATGTRLELQLRGNSANSWQMTVDGVTTTPSVGTSYTTVVVFEGQQGTRQIKLRNTDTSAVKLSGFGLLYGRPPSLSYATGFGPYYPIKDTTNSGNNRAFLKDDGSLKLGTYAGGYETTPMYDSGTAGYLRFKATTSSINLWCVRHTNGTNVRLAVDGVTQAAPVTAAHAVNSWGWLSWTGLDGTTEHEYRLIYDDHESTTQFPWEASVSGTMNTGALAAPTKLVAWYGDSITAGAGVAGASLGFPTQTMLAKGYGGRTAGLDFRTVRDTGAGGTSPGGGYSGEKDVARSLSAYISAPDEIVVLLGINDCWGAFGSTYNGASFGTAYAAMLTSLRSAYASANIRCLAPLETTSTGMSNRADCKSRIQTAVSGAGAGVTYHDTDGWITPASDTDDGLHPNTAGVAKIVTQLSAII